MEVDYKCPEHPEKFKGDPLGMYHCPYCGDMQVAGVPHIETNPEITQSVLGALHGIEITCPTCGAKGLLDLTNRSEVDPTLKGKSEVVVWYNHSTLQWECSECWLK